MLLHHRSLLTLARHGQLCRDPRDPLQSNLLPGGLHRHPALLPSSHPPDLLLHRHRCIPAQQQRLGGDLQGEATSSSSSLCYWFFWVLKCPTICHCRWGGAKPGIITPLCGWTQVRMGQDISLRSDKLFLLVTSLICPAELMFARYATMKIVSDSCWHLGPLWWLWFLLSWIERTKSDAQRPQTKTFLSVDCKWRG